MEDNAKGIPAEAGSSPPPATATQPGATCPPWCEREDEHEHHRRLIGHAGDVGVALVLRTGLAGPRKPEVYISHYRTLEDSSGVLLPLVEAADMAKLMAALGHEDIAVLITQAADGAR
jgi:hypothetical protein